MKISVRSSELKEVPLTLKNLDQSFVELTDLEIDIPNLNDKEILEDYIDNCDIQFSKEEIKQLPQLFNNWLEENPDIVKGIQIRHKLYEIIYPLIEKYGEDDVWYEVENLKSIINY